MIKSRINNKVFLAGHNGMVGKALYRVLKSKGHKKIITISRKKLDLTNQKKVNNFFKKNKFDQVYLCAAKVGGIMANQTYPANFIYDNLMIATNVIHASWVSNVKTLLFIGSSCIYPKKTKQPMKENYLLTSKLEESNEPYAISKIAGIKICESYNRQYDTDFRCVMPTNLYGVGDNFDELNSHVIPGLIVKIHRAKVTKLPSVKVWGSGKPKREFLYVEDMANLCERIINLSKKKIAKVTKPRMIHINLGTGKGISIKNLTKIVCKVVGYKGKIIFDRKYPDGHPQKVSDISIQKKLKCKISSNLRDGIKATYIEYLSKNNK